ncbi:hypothetical protein [Bacillus cereus group sp. BfR-BA-01448]|uniref:hypothetical protein n=1 Tax=Bacillus cereus group sp. BfR-BA-01448 TaxID=2920352 RepID=UPI001F5A6EB1|nr:hypothetical protein [Bacillus cereus group sp. BfR-BA-01448]
MKKITFIVFSLFLFLSFTKSPVHAQMIVDDSSKNVIDLKVVRSTTFYKSLSGKTIEYTPENLELINKTKLEDIKSYKKLTGIALTEEEVGITNTRNTLNRASLPPVIPVFEGKLMLVQQVLYKGTSGTNYKYQYRSVAEWHGNPLVHFTDVLASGWDSSAIPVANTFRGYWLQEQRVADGHGGTTLIREDKKLDADSDSFNGSGNAVKFSPGGGEYQVITMDRDILVPMSKAGDPANIITKYHHTYANLTGIAITIGPFAVNISSTWGDDTTVEYSFNYGDK